MGKAGGRGGGGAGGRGGGGKMRSQLSFGRIFNRFKVMEVIPIYVLN